MAVPSVPLSLTHLHAAFLTILPRIERHALIYFRGLRCPIAKMTRSRRRWGWPGTGSSV